MSGFHGKGCRPRTVGVVCAVIGMGLSCPNSPYTPKCCRNEKLGLSWHLVRMSGWGGRPGCHQCTVKFCESSWGVRMLCMLSHGNRQGFQSQNKWGALSRAPVNREGEGICGCYMPPEPFSSGID